jgi:TolB protein
MNGRSGAGRERIGCRSRFSKLAWLAAAVGAVLLGPAAPWAQERAPIVISDPSGARYRAAVLRFAAGTPDGAALADSIRSDIEHGLAFSGFFASIDPMAFLESATSPALDAEPVAVCPNWRQIGADALVQGEVTTAAPDRVRVEYRVLDVSRGCLKLGRKVLRLDRSQLERVGRRIADDIVGQFTGTPGVSDTEIAFVSDRTGSREIYVMDADGGSLRRATTHQTINSFPDWSPDGDSIVYTSYRYRNRAGLFLLTRGRKSPGRILRNLNGSVVYRGVFHPSGERLALVMSVDGATEIFSVAKRGSDLRRLTRTKAIEVSPTWSPDGSRLAFVSDRAGGPQIYVMDEDGGNQRRLTFNGSYNAAPTWSPDGRWIAYESRVGGQMDIWLIDPEGEANLPLVQHPRSDEHPAWSPDGRMLAFSSYRLGDGDIWLIDVNGENLRQVGDGTGNNMNPAWGPRRR